MELSKLKAIIEAVLCASDVSVSPGKLVGVFEGEGITGKEARAAIDELNVEYRRTGRVFQIVEVAGGFQMAVLKEYAPWVRAFQKERPIKLSRAALETLSIIAYRQPLIRVEIENIRGVDSGGVLKTLMERRLIRIAGRSDGIGKPLLYATTDEFLRYFGLRTLADLPKPKEFQDILQKRDEGVHPTE